MDKARAPSGILWFLIGVAVGGVIKGSTLGLLSYMV